MKKILVILSLYLLIFVIYSCTTTTTYTSPVVNDDDSAYVSIPYANSYLASQAWVNAKNYLTTDDDSAYASISFLNTNYASQNWIFLNVYKNRTLVFLDNDTPTSGAWTPPIKIPESGIITGFQVYTSTVGATTSQIGLSYMSSIAYNVNGGAASSGWTNMLTSNLTLTSGAWTNQSTLTNIIYATTSAFTAGTYFRINVANLATAIRGLVAELSFKTLVSQ